MEDVLPINAVLDEIASALETSGVAVLQAPPGAGKTTGVPLHLLSDERCQGQILMLEPRRIAARAAALRMSVILGEQVGRTVGYKFRGEQKVAKGTRILVVTEGVLVRMIQDDPSLDGVSCVIFDEFHERNLLSDLSLALTLEVREALRPELKLLVMSATLDTEPVAQLLKNAPIISSEGRSFPIDVEYLEKPLPDRSWGDVARAISEEARKAAGSVLAFLPGAYEIDTVIRQLAVPDSCKVLPLHGGLPFDKQKAALEDPAAGQTNVVVASAIAETSVTIPDVVSVVDAGYARRPVFDPNTGMSRLVTRRVSKAEALQRAGRAGRVGPGKAIRLWTRGEEGGFPAYPPVEIEANDLFAFALELARWGVREPTDLALLTPPPASTLSEAQAFLKAIGALAKDGALTDHGRAIAAIPTHPRLAHMICRGDQLGMGGSARDLASLISETRRGESEDLAEDLRAFRRSSPPPLLAAARRERKRLGTQEDTARLSPGAVLSLGFPDRIALQRGPGSDRYLLSGGTGARVEKTSPLSDHRWIVAADLDGDRTNARVRRGAVASEVEIRDLHELKTATVTEWDSRTERVVSEEQERIGALVLKRRPVKADPEESQRAMLAGLRDLGLGALRWTTSARSLQQRVSRARRAGVDVPDISDSALLAKLDQWIGHLISGSAKSDFAKIDVKAALESFLGWNALQDVNRAVPEFFCAPTGSRLRIDYASDPPSISIKLQEMLGTTSHPSLGDGVPLSVVLLSPAGRPLQTTTDIPGFWNNAYLDVRKEMRGRYPKHNWPENPAAAIPTKRTLKLSQK